MWKALDLLQRNVTRSLPPRRDTGARGSSGGGAPGVDSSSAKITSKTSAAWIPQSIMNVKKDIFKADFPRLCSVGYQQNRTRGIYPGFTRTRSFCGFCVTSVPLSELLLVL